MKKLSLKIKILLKILRIKVKIDKTQDGISRWKGGRTIYIKENARDIDVLHEIGHVFNGTSCCREHCEFMAHGFSMGIARILGIPTLDIDNRMDCYSGINEEKDIECDRLYWKKIKSNWSNLTKKEKYEIIRRKGYPVN